jgi:hypothetical protein
MNTNATTKSIAIEETARTFEGDIANADALRASALTGLQRLRAAKANHIQREQTRLAGELGEEHPDVVRLKAELAGDQRFVRELGAEIDRAKTEAPVVDKQSWALHGFVRNEDLEGQPKLTLALFDRGGSWVEVLGHSCTDSRGYFQLRYERSTESRTDAIAANVRSEMFIHVSDQKQKVLYYDKRPVKVELGRVEYREIILKVADAPCVPPPTPESTGADSPAKPSKPSSRPRRKSPRKTKPSK